MKYLLSIKNKFIALVSSIVILYMSWLKYKNSSLTEDNEELIEKNNNLKKDAVVLDFSLAKEKEGNSINNINKESIERELRAREANNDKDDIGGYTDVTV